MKKTLRLLIVARLLKAALAGMLLLMFGAVAPEVRAQCDVSCPNRWIPRIFSFELDNGCIVQVAAMMNECPENSDNWHIMFTEAALVDPCSDCLGTIPDEAEMVEMIKYEIWNKNVLHFQSGINLTMLWPNCWQDNDIDRAWGCSTDCCSWFEPNWMPGSYPDVTTDPGNACIPPCANVCN